MRILNETSAKTEEIAKKPTAPNSNKCFSWMPFNQSNTARMTISTTTLLRLGCNRIQIPKPITQMKATKLRSPRPPNGSWLYRKQSLELPRPIARNQNIAMKYYEAYRELT